MKPVARTVSCLQGGALFRAIQGASRPASPSSIKPGSLHHAIITITKILAAILALLLSITVHAAVAPPASTQGLAVHITNLGARFELRETSAPAKLPNHPGVRYFTTPDGALVAMANRLLVVVSNPRTLARILELPQVIDHAPLAQLEKTHIELLETADVATALALLAPLAQMPGVISAQPDLSQNITRHDGGYFNWERFDLRDAIGLREAWRLTLGQGVRVAIIDSGINLQHKDLRGAKLLAGFDVERRSQRIAPEDAQNPRHPRCRADFRPPQWVRHRRHRA